MPVDVAPSSRDIRGKQNYLDGIVAEDCVMRAYLAAGADLLAKRWRGRSGEIDLIFRESDGIVFVEVKKSATHDGAAERLSRSQMRRIFSAAEEYAGTLPNGLLTPMRLDAALVDNAGQVEIIKNISVF